MSWISLLFIYFNNLIYLFNLIKVSNLIEKDILFIEDYKRNRESFETKYHIKCMQKDGILLEVSFHDIDR
jgi:hypothetical protein